MINLTDMQGIIADAFFNGDTGIAGMVIFAVVMMIIFAIFGTDHIMLSFVMMLPITLIFSALKILPDSMAILLIIVAVSCIAANAQEKCIINGHIDDSQLADGKEVKKVYLTQTDEFGRATTVATAKVRKGSYTFKYKLADNLNNILIHFNIFHNFFNRKYDIHPVIFTKPFIFGR